MKQLCLFMVTLLMATACNNEEWKQPTGDEICIYGNSVDESTSGGRGGTRMLEEGATLSLYATGGIDCNGEILTYSEPVWKGEHPITWQNELPAEVCAYHPPLPKRCNELYAENGQLKDVLIAQASYPFGGNIGLHFKHLFSQLVFHVDETFNQQIASVAVSTDRQITQLNAYTGEITTEKGVAPLVTTLLPNTAGDYQLLLPPGEKQSIVIRIQTKDGITLRKELTNLNIQRNESYAYKVKRQPRAIGIATAEDYIAFTNLINGKSYGKRTLSEFGVTEGGKTTYYLTNDIHFTDSQRGKIHPIGLHGFVNIFDGQGHTLSNLRPLEDDASYSGIFAEIKRGGIVKNLHIRDCCTSFKKTGGYTGILCGKNSGVIMNCSITDCQLITNKDHIGGLVGSNYGTLANCSVTNFTLSVSTDMKNTNGIEFGGITYMNGEHAIIANCCIDCIQRKTKFKATVLACICSINGHTVSNCLTDHAPTDYYPFCRSCTSFCDHCYYPAELWGMTGNIGNMDRDQQQKNNVLYFSDTPKSRQNIVNRLNHWVDNEGQQKYPRLQLKHWKLSPDGTISLENH